MNKVDIMKEAANNEFLAVLFPEKYNYTIDDAETKILELKNLGFVKEYKGNVNIPMSDRLSISSPSGLPVNDFNELYKSFKSYLRGDLESAKEYKSIFESNNLDDQLGKGVELRVKEKKRIIEERKFFSLYEALRGDNARNYRGGEYVNSLISPLEGPIITHNDIKVTIPLDSFAKALPDMFGYDENYGNPDAVFNRGGITLKGFGITFKCAVGEIPSGYGVYDILTNEENVLGAGLEVPMRVKLELGRFMSNNFEIVHKMVMDEKIREDHIKKMENPNLVKRAFYKLVDTVSKWYQPEDAKNASVIEIKKEIGEDLAKKAAKFRRDIADSGVSKKTHY